MINSEISVGKLVALAKNPAAIPARKQQIMLAVNLPNALEHVEKKQNKIIFCAPAQHGFSPVAYNTEMNADVFVMRIFPCI